MKEAELLARVKEVLDGAGHTRLLSLVTSARLELRRLCSGYENWAPYPGVELYRLVVDVPAGDYAGISQETQELADQLLAAANSVFASKDQEIDLVEIRSD